jgi:UPF0042 nucleotide-binding protein
MVFDCRFLKNPNWVENLKPLDGTDKNVARYLKKDKSWVSFRDSLRNMILHLTPAFEKEGKYYLSIGFGCTGGKHRSVFVSQYIFDEMQKKDFDVGIIHSGLSLLPTPSLIHR